jgi:hypothetical protein
VKWLCRIGKVLAMAVAVLGVAAFLFTGRHD